MNKGIELWFPTPFYFATDIISKEENQRVLEECYNIREQNPDNPHRWACDIYTSFTTDNLINNKNFRRLFAAIEDHMDYFSSSLGILGLSCRGSWFNIAGPKQYQEKHIHPENRLSLIYYCKTPEGSADTYFNKPYYDMYPLYLNGQSNESIKYKAEACKLVIFLSNMPHFVPQGTNTDDRVSISANYT